MHTGPFVNGVCVFSQFCVPLKKCNLSSLAERDVRSLLQTTRKSFLSVRSVRSFAGCLSFKCSVVVASSLLPTTSSGICEKGEGEIPNGWRHAVSLTRKYYRNRPPIPVTHGIRPTVIAAGRPPNCWTFVTTHRSHCNTCLPN